MLEVAIGQVARELRVHGSDGAGQCDRTRETTREWQWRGRIGRVGTALHWIQAAEVPMVHRSIYRFKADGVGQSYRLKFLLGGVQDNSSELGKC